MIKLEFTIEELELIVGALTYKANQWLKGDESFELYNLKEKIIMTSKIESDKGDKK